MSKIFTLSLIYDIIITNLIERIGEKVNILEILLGQLPEALYFALFMILSKRLTSKRILFTSLTTMEYLLLLNSSRFSTWSHILYFALTFIILKMLYKEKSQITDIFTLGIASIIMILVSGICYLIISMTVKNVIICNIIAKGILFILLFVFRHKLYNIQNLYKHFWNRNNKPKKIKSATFRCINIVAFNFMFYVLNGIMIYCLFWNGGE